MKKIKKTVAFNSFCLCNSGWMKPDSFAEEEEGRENTKTCANLVYLLSLCIFFSMSIYCVFIPDEKQREKIWILTKKHSQGRSRLYMQENFFPSLIVFHFPLSHHLLDTLHLSPEYSCLARSVLVWKANIWIRMNENGRKTKFIETWCVLLIKAWRPTRKLGREREREWERKKKVSEREKKEREKKHFLAQMNRREVFYEG